MQKNRVMLAIGMLFFIAVSQMASAKWEKTGTLSCNNVAALAVNGSSIFAGTKGGGVFLSINNGTNWVAANSGLTHAFVNALAVSGGTIYAGIENGVFKSRNNGTSWTEVNSGLKDHEAVYALAVSDRGIFAGTSGYVAGVYFYEKSGPSWTEASAGLGRIGIWSLAVNRNDVCAGSHKEGVFLSSNDGTSWTRVDSGLPSKTWVYCLIPSGNTMLVGTDSAGVFRLANNGRSWTAVNSGLTKTDVYSLAASGGKIFAGTQSGGIFISINGGTSWASVNSGMTNSSVYSLVVSGDYVFAGTNDAGVWRCPISEIIGEGITCPMAHAIPGGFTIHVQSHRIAFATIEFSLPHQDRISIDIHSISGDKIATLVNGQLAEGPYKFRWNIRNIAAGQYIVRVRLGSKTYLANLPICL